MIMDIKERLTHHGWVFLPKFNPDLGHELAAARIGAMISLGEGKPVHMLSPQPQNSSLQNSYSGHFGTGLFPYHTDMAILNTPPRYMFLRCQNGSIRVKTTILDGREIQNAFPNSIFARAMFQPKNRTREGYPLLRLVERVDDDVLFRWDPLHLKHSNPSGKKLSELVFEFIHQMVGVSVALSNYGDSLILDNWRILHGRSDASVHSDRKIARCYMSEIW